MAQTNAPALNSRESLIAWLITNDPNGCHSDEDTLAETGAVHTLETARACYRAVMDGDTACYHCARPIDSDPVMDDDVAYHAVCYATAIRTGAER